MSDPNAAETAVGLRSRRRRRSLVAIVAAVVVVAAGGTYLGLRLSSGTGPPTSGLATVWTQNGDPCPPVSQGALPWTADGLAIVCSGGEALAAYRLGTGRVAWTWRTPSAADSPGTGANAPIYQTSANINDGIGVVAYYADGEEPGPAVLAGIDMTNGRQLWRLPVTLTTTDTDTDLPGIWEGGGRFAAVMRSGSSYALGVYDLATGALSWSSTSRQIPPAGCEVSGDAISGQSVYIVTSCYTGPFSQGADQLYQMSLQTGSVIAQVPLQDAPCMAHYAEPTLWAVGGYVLSGCDSPMPTPDVVIIPAGGVRQHALTWSGNNGYLDNLSAHLQPPGIAISGSTLYVGEDSGTAGRDNQEVEQIAAIDLGTARLRWYRTVSIPGANPNGTYYPVNVIGASSRGVLDVIENVGDDAVNGRSGMTLALLSAADGTLTYGPGTTYSPPAGLMPAWFTVAGDMLVSFDSCPVSGCPSEGNGVTVTAYSLGSWPG